jgi:glycosyltransferase involved in cell wall biosynthesis
MNRMNCGPPELFRGYFDRCDRDRLIGWAFDPTQPDRPVMLEIRCDGELIGHIVADHHRDDLEASGEFGSGFHGFECSWPLQPTPSTSHIIEIRRAADGMPVPNSPQILAPAAELDETSQAWLSGVLRDVAVTATAPEQLDTAIGLLAQQTEILLSARARLEGGGRTAGVTPRARWGGLTPTAEIADRTACLKPLALFVDATFPVEGDNAGSNAALDHMRSLLRLGFDLCFVAVDDLADRAQGARFLAERGVTALSGPWYASVEEILQRHAGKFDLVYLHRAEIAASYAKLVRKHLPDALLLYGVADLHYLRLARQAAVENKASLRQQARAMQFHELVAARVADAVITHSAAEAALLRDQIPDVSVAVIPWAVPLRASDSEFRDRENVLFVGNFAHSPNVDALQLIAGSILPWVRRKAAEITFRIVGSNMPEQFHRISQPGLEIIGAVEDMAEPLGTARLSIAPLRFGAGLKGKVVESLAAGVPCIGTSIAYEGIDMPPALERCIADTPEALADTIVELYRDAAAHAAIAAAGQRYALITYSEAAIDARMREVVAPVLNRWAGLTSDQRMTGFLPVR